MKLDSVRSFKQELSDRYAAEVTEMDPPMARFFEATDPQHYDGSIISSVRQQVTQYRENKSTFFTFSGLKE
jgi:hypothetical protein